MNFYSWDNHSTLKRKTGGGKARLDVSYFLKKKGYKSLKYYNSQNVYLKILFLIINFILFPFLIEKGSVLFVQYPHNIGQRNILKFYKNIKNIKTIFLVHDLESIRSKRDKKIEALDLKFSDYIISLNAVLTSYIQNELNIKNKKIVNLDLWDYYVSEESSSIVDIDLTEDAEKYKCNILIAGNLDKNKVGYLNQLGEISDVRFYLMGDNLDKEIKLKENIKYLGAFNSDTRVNYFGGDILGLVWDGESIETCSGNYGKYLKKNLPHKTSFYLSNMIPVVIWNDAALSRYLKEVHIGLGIDSLCDLSNIAKISGYFDSEILFTEKEKLKNGYYLSKALSDLDMLK